MTNANEATLILLSTSPNKMSLANFPNELLSIIFEQCLLSGGFEDLALSCKRCYAVAQRYTKSYNEQMLSWRRINGRGSKPEAPPSTMLDMIRAIQENSDRARWVRFLDLYRFEKLKVKDDCLERIDLELLIDHITSRPWFSTIPDKNALCTWIRHHSMEEEGNERRDSTTNHQRVLTWTVVLLLLLYNAETIIVPMSWKHIAEEDLSMLSKMALHLHTQRSGAKSTKGRSFPLGNLRSVYYPGHFLLSQSDTSLSAIAPFLSSEVLEKLQARTLIAMDGSSTNMSFTWPYHGFTSNLKTIKLEQCCIEPRCLTELLYHAPHVENFVYSHIHTTHHGRDWSAGAFIAAIGIHIGKTLRQLSVTIDSSGCKMLTGAHSLKDFTAIEECVLDLDTICGPPMSDMLTTVAEPKRWTISRMRKVMPQIENILPTNIKKLTLKVEVGSRMEAEHYTALSTLFRAKQNIATIGPFPSLEELVVDIVGSSRGLGSLENLLKECGVKLTFSGPLS